MASLRKKEILEAQLSPIVPSFMAAQISRLSKVLSEERLKPEFTIELKSLVHRKRAEQASALLDESGVPTLYLPPPKPSVPSTSSAVQPPNLSIPQPTNPSSSQSVNQLKTQSANAVGPQAPVASKNQSSSEGWTFMSGQQQKNSLTFEEALFSILSSPTQNCLIRNERSLSVLTQDFVRSKFEEFANELEISLAPSTLPAPVPAPTQFTRIRSSSNSSEEPPARPPQRGNERPNQNPNQNSKGDSRQGGPSMSNPYAQGPKAPFSGPPGAFAPPAPNPYFSTGGSFGNPYPQKSQGFSAPQPQNPYAAQQRQPQFAAQGPYGQFPPKSFAPTNQNPYLSNAGFSQSFEDPQELSAPAKRRGQPNRAPAPKAPAYPPTYPASYPPSFDPTPSPYMQYEEEEFFRGTYKQAQNPYSSFATQPRKPPQEVPPRAQKTQRIQQPKQTASRLEHPYPEDPEPEFQDSHRANPYLTGRVAAPARNNFEDFDLDPRLAPSRQKRVFNPQSFHQ